MLRVPAPILMRVMRLSSRRDAGKRSVQVFLAIVCAALQLGVAAHFFLVQHALCAEHGDLVHADSPHASQVASERAAEAQTNAPVLQTGQALDDAHEHDHCLQSNARGRSVIEAREGRLTEAPRAASVPIHAVVRSPEPRALRSLKLLLLAPKNSPPCALIPTFRSA